MHSTLAAYRRRIADHAVDPVRRWDGRTSAALLDCRDDAVPLSVLSMHAFALDAGPVDIATADREWLVMPVDGRLAVQVADASFDCDRTGGPFAAWPGGCNASAVYLPRNARATLAGRGEAIAFSAPAFDDRPPARVDAAGSVVGRGSGLWFRDVATLATPGDVTTNLVMGETYSPPGLWSGTPLHVHDRARPDAGQSDHEEIYYHLAPDPSPDAAWGPYGVQLLFDDQGLDQAWMIHHRTAFAIPGAAHPVVAGPNSEMMYVWCLASDASQPLGMADVPEFAWLKRVGAVLDQLAAAGRRSPLSKAEIAGLAAAADLDESQCRVLTFHLAQAGLAARPTR